MFRQFTLIANFAIVGLMLVSTSDLNAQQEYIELVSKQTGKTFQVPVDSLNHNMRKKIYDNWRKKWLKDNEKLTAQYENWKAKKDRHAAEVEFWNRELTWSKSIPRDQRTESQRQRLLKWQADLIKRREELDRYFDSNLEPVISDLARRRKTLDRMYERLKKEEESKYVSQSKRKQPNPDASQGFSICCRSVSVDSHPWLATPESMPG